jgi:hypothetical protein
MLQRVYILKVTLLLRPGEKLPNKSWPAIAPILVCFSAPVARLGT